MNDAPFSLHSRLEADTFHVKDGPVSAFRLMDDARYWWLILVPRITGVRTYADVPAKSRAILMEEIVCAENAIRSVAAPEHINAAQLGNQVPQLHIHVIGRSAGDPAWPGPIWGVGAPVPLSNTERTDRVARLHDALP
ncbi:MAG: HIT family protein [Pseudomonadota bacterium]